MEAVVLIYGTEHFQDANLYGTGHFEDANFASCLDVYQNKIQRLLGDTKFNPVCNYIMY